jgi:hypothetical protein
MIHTVRKAIFTAFGMAIGQYRAQLLPIFKPPAELRVACMGDIFKL